MSNPISFSKLRETDTFRTLLDVKHNSLFYSLSSPIANKEQSILVMKILGDNLILNSVLDETNSTLSFKERFLKKIVYMMVNKKPQTFTISLNYDNRQSMKPNFNISATVDYQVVDNEKLLNQDYDSVKEMKQTVDKILKEAQGLGIEPSKVNLQNDTLEKSILKSLNNLEGVLGIMPLNVKVKIDFDEAQFGSCKTMWSRIEDANKLLEAVEIVGISLKSLIENVDLRLLLDFYFSNWTDSMDKFIVRLNELIDGKALEDKIRILKDIKADEIYIDNLNEIIAEIIDGELKLMPIAYNVTNINFENDINSQLHNFKFGFKKYERTINNDANSQKMSESNEFGTYQKQWNHIAEVTRFLEAINIGGYSLKAVIEKIDFRLILNFYYLSLEKSFQKLMERLDAIYMGDDYTRKVDLLKNIGTDEYVIERVRNNISKIVIKHVSPNAVFDEISPNASVLLE